MILQQINLMKNTPADRAECTYSINTTISIS